MKNSRMEAKTCPDCGNVPLHHRLEWMKAAVGEVFTVPTAVTDYCWARVEPLIGEVFYNRFSPALFKMLARMRLGTIVYAPDEHTGHRARVLWNEAIKRGISMYEFRLFGIGKEAFVAEFPVTGLNTIGSRKRIICFDGLPRPEIADSHSLKWMDNKNTMRKKFAAAGIPIARGGRCFSYSTAKKLFEKLEKPVVVKPHTGSFSRHTFTHIINQAELETAFKSAKQLSPFVIIEEEIRGSVYRGTVIGGKVAAVLRRDPPMVYGDGVHSVKELIEIENAHPKRQSHISHGIFHTIETQGGSEAHDVDSSILQKELARQGLSLASVPAKAAVVMLSQKVIRGGGGTTTDVTDETHPDTIALLEKVAATLGDSLVGVDVIVEDISASWQQQNDGHGKKNSTAKIAVIECNSLPYISSHHFPFTGEPRNVAGMLWDLVFPFSKNAFPEK